MTPLAAYLLLFVAVGVGFIFVHLVAGMLIRPSKKNLEKDTIYECGEPTIGSAWVQFDLRFYVVALLFVIFDVEVAFFFPWAEVFGKANAIRNAPAQPQTALEYRDVAKKVLDLAPPEQPAERAGTLSSERMRRDRIHWTTMQNLTQDKLDRFKELQGKDDDTKLLTAEDVKALKVPRVNEVQDQAETLAWLALIEIGVFFGVLLVGFAYLWKRGDLAWVRSMAAETVESASSAPVVQGREMVGAGR